MNRRLTDHPVPASRVARLVLASALMMGTAAALFAASPRLQVFFAADFKDAAYQKKTFDRVAKRWARPATSPKPGGKAVVVTSIRRDGAVSGTRLHHRSGADAWDAAALRAVSKASPFDPLPKAYAPDSVEVHFHFEVVE